MEVLFSVLASAALGYIIDTQEKLRNQISEVSKKVDRIEFSMPKRRTDHESNTPD